MSIAPFEHVLPWTEEEFLELGETPDRVELFDGSLYVSPSATPEHQDISFWLTALFNQAARSVGLRVYQVVNLRLRPGRIPIPDLVIVKDIDRRVPIVEASAAALVCEIVSPSNAATDRVLKMHYYAEAGIAWYLLADPRPDLRLQLFRLVDGRYVLDSQGSPGHPLRMSDPVVVDLDPAELEP